MGEKEEKPAVETPSPAPKEEKAEPIVEQEAIRTCPKCGAQLPIWAAFCGKCGARLEGGEEGGEKGGLERGD